MTIESINHKITYVGLPLKPIYFAWINITDSIILELWKNFIHAYFQNILKDRDRFENCLSNGKMASTFIIKKTRFLGP